MHRITIRIAACFAVVVTAGCGTVTASQPGTGGHTVAPGTTAQASKTPGTGHGLASSHPASTGPAGGGSAAGCNGGVAAQGLMITLAGNGKTYCVRVGENLQVSLQGTVSSMWLQPLASSDALKPVPNGALSLVKGITGASFDAVKPGQVLITSVRPPCQFNIAQWKFEGGIEPAFPLPKTYPLKFCAPAHRFSTMIIVMS